MHPYTDPMKTLQLLQRRLRNTELGVAIGVAFIALLTALVLVALVDFSFEISESIRTLLFSICVGVAAIGLTLCCVRIVRRWTISKTASHVESHYPQAGQSIRTAAEFSAKSDSHRNSGNASKPSWHGTSPHLQAALQDDVRKKLAQVDFTQVAPTHRVWFTTCCLTVILVVLGASFFVHPLWATSLMRIAGGDFSYSTLTMQTGDSHVHLGESLPIKFFTQGRPRENVSLQWRPADSEVISWTTVKLDNDNRTKLAGSIEAFETQIQQISDHLEFQIIAGSEQSPIYRVNVIFPLKLIDLQATIKAPDYTGRGTQVVKGGNFSALQGSTANVSVTLDREPQSVSVTSNRLGKAVTPTPPMSYAVNVEGCTLQWEMPLDHDLTWQIEAMDADNAKLAQQLYRVRIRHDQRPEISFRSPNRDTEVHSLAEVLLSIRAADDYGLSRTGIVFQINNLQEHTLIEEDFAETLAAFRELELAGQNQEPPQPKTQLILSRKLPLEYFSLSQTDTVAYYAFAEDNFSDHPQRTQTELRFIDIVPFREDNRLNDASNAGNNRSAQNQLRRGLATLESLIRQERRLLAQTWNLRSTLDQNTTQPEKLIDPAAVAKMLDEQANVSALTRELAEFIERFQEANEFEMLYRAEASMLAAVDALSTLNLDATSTQQIDAQQYLVESRNELRRLLNNNASARVGLALFSEEMESRSLLDSPDSERYGKMQSRLTALSEKELYVSKALSSLQNIPESDSAMAEIKNRQIITLEETQYELTNEIMELATGALEMSELSDLIRNRIESSSEFAQSTSNSLDKGDLKNAAEESRQAGVMLREIAVQLELLATPEFVQKIAGTVRLMKDLTETERNTIQMLKSEQDDPTSLQERNQEGLETLEARSSSLIDLFNSMKDDQSQYAGDGPTRINDLLEEQMAIESLERIQQAAKSLRDDRDAPLDTLIKELEDTRDRNESTTAALERLHRSLVTPRLARLRELEADAMRINRRMQILESVADIDGWNRELDRLLASLEADPQTALAGRELTLMVNTQQASTAETWQSHADQEFLTPPPALESHLKSTTQNLRRLILELVLSDYRNQRDEPIPGDYVDLVNAYFQTIASEQ